MKIIHERMTKDDFTKNDQILFRSVPQNTSTSVDIGNLRNGTKRNGTIVKYEMGLNI